MNATRPAAGARVPLGSPSDLATTDTWVLLRGLTREAGHWGNFPAQLVDCLPQARVLTLDLPGNGHLHQQPSPSRIAAMTDVCRQQLQALGIAPPYRLLALSMGAMVAVDWAARHPQELLGCVLVNTSLRPFSPWYRRLRPATYLTLLRLVFGGSLRAQEQKLLRLTSRLSQADEQVLDEWVALRRARPVAWGNAWRQLLAAACYRAPCALPRVPLLLLCSRRDALVHPGCSQRLARVWGAHLVEHPSAGHDLPLDDGPWVAQQVQHWVAARRL